MYLKALVVGVEIERDDASGQGRKRKFEQDVPDATGSLIGTNGGMQKRPTQSLPIQTTTEGS